MGVNGVIYMQSIQPAKTVKNSTRAVSFENRRLFSEILNDRQKECPYSSLAKDGLIEYNGVEFVCDYESNSICLGDMSNPKDVLNISLPSGGHLKVNVNSFDDLFNAIGMFSPADICAIMKAVSQYNHCVRKLHEVEKGEFETVENVTEQTNLHNYNTAESLEHGENHADTPFSTVTLFHSTSGTASFSNAIKQFEEVHRLEAQKLKEEKDWRNMSAEEWDKMLEGVDNYIDALKERLKEMKKLQDEAAQKAALEADPEMKSIAASSAALAATNGFVSGSNTEEYDSEIVSTEAGVEREKNWTKTLQTDNKIILMKAQEAQKMEYRALSKFRELQLVGSIEAGKEIGKRTYDPLTPSP